MSTPVFKTTPTGINYNVSLLSLAGTLQGTSSVVPSFFHYLSNSNQETISLLEAGTYSFEVVRDSRWNNDGSYLTVLGSITYLDGTKKDLVGRLNTYMGGVLFSNGAFDFSVNDFLTNSFDSFLRIGQFAPGNNADIGKKFSFTVSQTSPTYSISTASTSVNEGSSVTFQITTSSVEWGSTLNYTLSGISSTDISGGLLNGTTTVVQNGNSGIATVTLAIAADQTTEGNETLVLTAGGSRASIVVNDTSKPASTYSLISNAVWTNEGGNALFTLNTTNLTAGSMISYTLSGISTNDVKSKSLTGAVPINENGTVAISIPLENDLLTEGLETLVISIANTTATTIIADTSRGSSTPTKLSSNNHYYEVLSGAQYTVTDLLGNAISIASSASYRGLHGYLATVTSASENALIASLLIGDQVGFLGASDNDASGVWKWISGPESGNLLSNYYTNWYPGEPSNNAFGTAGPSSEDALAISPSTKWQGRWWDTSDFFRSDVISGDIVVEYGGLPGTYQISSNAAAVNEGTQITFTISTTNIEWGTSVPFSISGISASDISLGALTGYVTIVQQGIEGGATLSFDILSDQLTEGSETLFLTVGSATASTVVNDTSKSTPTYSLVASSPSVNEGSAATFTLTTTNLTSGTSVPYSISGLSSTDVSGGVLSGNAVINSSGIATISISLISDSLTEGDETLTISAGGATASTVVNDTSKSLATYSISASNSSVNEGGTLTFTITTANSATGTYVPYTIYGVSSADVMGGLLSGNALVNENGIATVSIALLNDFLTEGDETLTISAGGVTASSNVSDTSKSLPTYSLVANNPIVNEGSIATFTLTTTIVAAGATIPYVISGISSSDVVGGVLSGNVIANSNGTASITVTLANDQLTEGSETLTISAGGATASSVVNDTSKSVTYSESHNLAVLVDKSVLGPLPMLLKGLNEIITFTNGIVVSHIVQYAGIDFSYEQIDSFITTVTRDGEFTLEFSKEINDYVQSEANITYKVAVALVGAQNIDNVIVAVAGADGNYVG